MSKSSVEIVQIEPFLVPVSDTAETPSISPKNSAPERIGGILPCVMAEIKRRMESHAEDSNYEL